MQNQYGTQNVFATEKENSNKIETAISLLSASNDAKCEYFHQYEKPLPSIEKLKEIVELLKAIIFPGYFGNPIQRQETLPHLIGVNVAKLYELLTEQILRGLYSGNSNQQLNDYPEIAAKTASAFIERLPEIKRMLCTDVKAIYDGDPAAKSHGEIIFCYPSIRAMINHRAAHELVTLEVPLIPRIISEMAHSETGIDIHPGAQIGEYFCIDHGTGVVIGETCEIGNNVRLYQGVTLGAKRFTLDEHGNPVKNVPRHPIIEDNVVIYSNANILGRITIGQNSIIGGNVWVTKSVPPNSKIQQQKAVESNFADGLGI